MSVLAALEKSSIHGGLHKVTLSKLRPRIATACQGSGYGSCTPRQTRAFAASRALDALAAKGHKVECANVTPHAAACRTHGSIARHDKCLHLCARPVYQRPIFRASSTKSQDRNQTAAVAYDVPRSELRNLVSYYTESHDEVSIGPTFAPLQQVPPRSPVRLPLEGYDALPPSSRRMITFINNNQDSPGAIFREYQSLPEPRPCQLPEKYIHKVLTNLSMVEHKDSANALRYLSVVDECKAWNIPLTVRHWTSAISFAGRCVKRITNSEIDSALATWSEMETEAGVKADATTFNVLFDVAVKAEKFVLADMLLREMQVRELPLDRYARTGIIRYHAKKCDGNGVRKAYKDLVEAGEIVDTTILNSVIGGFLEAGEPAMAEITFERMKRLDAQLSGKVAPPRTWKKRKMLGKKLKLRTDRTRNKNLELIEAGGHPSISDAASTALEPREGAFLGPTKSSDDAEIERQRIQNNVSIGPSLATYKLFMRHYCLSSGDWLRVQQLLKELRSSDNDFCVSGSLYFHLFCGFTIHGRTLYSEWTDDRLERIFEAFMQDLTPRSELTEEEGTERKVYMTKSIVKVILEAYGKCSNDARLVDVWEQLIGKWEASEEDFKEAMEWMKEMSNSL
ncbi:MAG: hypothetical protein M1828_000500 [Chrysothrix sp. TS-e1954]|nr:MAG: hypothetical protein M1828_000500 [Chrysothrix sp. TS-e1954]